MPQILQMIFIKEKFLYQLSFEDKQVWLEIKFEVLL